MNSPEDIQMIVVNSKTYEMRDDGSGNRFWRLNGERHREDGPAIEFANGTRWWYLNGERHREDGPAVEWVWGDREWYRNDKLHREDGPAIEKADGDREWYLNGKRHREDGSAIEISRWYRGTKHRIIEWYYKGIKLQVRSLKGFKRVIKLFHI
jgi:hypothetical protein